jgi:uncharacterized hydantoinase/oxoprolinase family protein
VLAGSGEMLAQGALGRAPAYRPDEIVSLSEALGPDASRAACAVALCRLALEMEGERL